LAILVSTHATQTLVKQRKKERWGKGFCFMYTSAAKDLMWVEKDLDPSLVWRIKIPHPGGQACGSRPLSRPPTWTPPRPAFLKTNRSGADKIPDRHRSLLPVACSLQLRLRGDKNIGDRRDQETEQFGAAAHMAECRAGGGGDGLIKLFGKTIPVPEAAAVVGDADKVCKPLPIFIFYQTCPPYKWC
jgi:hypothetical protein